MIAGCLLVSAPGCGKTLEGTSGSKTTEQGVTKPPAPAPAPGPAPVTLPGEERVSDDIVVAKAEPSSEAAQAAKQRTQEMQQEAAATAQVGFQDVFFAFDKWTVSDEGKAALGADARWLKANAARAVVIEGHCDERGTQAYNLVLGEKRAKAVRSYLMDLGIDAKRLTVTSYGKDRPFCQERTEDCYQQNRRGHLVLRVK
jgi:peptidoglycan-associated lipoprotein